MRFTVNRAAAAVSSEPGMLPLSAALSGLLVALGFGSSRPRRPLAAVGARRSELAEAKPRRPACCRSEHAELAAHHACCE